MYYSIICYMNDNYNNLFFFSFSELKQELEIDKNTLQNFITNDIMKFWDEVGINGLNIDDGIIDLFSLLDNRISQYLQKWNRLTLTKVYYINKI